MCIAIAAMVRRESLPSSPGGGQVPAGTSKRGRGCGIRSPRRQFYVANKNLGVARAPTAFACFLSSLRGRVKKQGKRRLTAKTPVFRFDLLKAKFKSLTREERLVFEQRAGEALRMSKQQRAAALQAPGLQCRQLDIVAEGTIAERGVAKPAVAVLATSGPNCVNTRYQVMDAVLGQGSFGSCRVASDDSTGARFCVKFARPDKLSQAALLTENAFMQRLNHPNLLRSFGLLAVEPSEEPTALLLPLMSSNLWKFVLANFAEGQRLRPASYDTAVAVPTNEFQKRSFALQVLAGLGHMHHHRAVHLDLKPDNVLVHPASPSPLDEEPAVAGWRCCVADFGNSQAMEGVQGIRAEPKCLANCINASEYRPFDLIDCGGCEVRVHPRHDMWAFGCLLFDLMQGNPRLRNGPGGAALRLMSGVDLRRGELISDARWRLRDIRLRYVDKQCAAVIRQVQPRRQLGQRAATRIATAAEVAAEIGLWPCGGQS